MISLLSRIFGEKKPKYELEYEVEEINLAKQKEAEMEDYIPICARLFNGKVKGGLVMLSNHENMTDLDKMIYPKIIAGSLLGPMGGGVVCDESCPGYTAIPVEAFRFPGTRDVIKCRRFIPPELIDKVGGWEELRSRALAFGD